MFRRNLVSVSAVVVGALMLQCLFVLVATAECPQGCTCTKPKEKTCDVPAGGVTCLIQPFATCSGSVEYSAGEDVLLDEEPNPGEETKVNVDADPANKVKCYTEYPCFFDLLALSCETRIGIVGRVNPLKLVPCFPQ